MFKERWLRKNIYALLILCYSSRAYSDNEYINQYMLLIKYIQEQI
jgi:hypothetical protein